MTTKNSQSPAPLWQELDDTFEELLRVKRRREEFGIYSARRITDRRKSAAKTNDDHDDVADVEQPDGSKANIRSRKSMTVPRYVFLKNLPFHVIIELLPL
jgi:hypothetical protein